MRLVDSGRRILNSEINVGWAIIGYVIMLGVTWGAFAYHDSQHSIQEVERTKQVQLAQIEYSNTLSSYDLCITQVQNRNQIREVLLFIFLDGKDIDDDLRGQVVEFVNAELPLASESEVCGLRPLPPALLSESGEGSQYRGGRDGD